MNVQCRGFHSVAHELYFQDHLPSNTITETQCFVYRAECLKVLSPGEWLKAIQGDMSNEHAQQSLPSVTDERPFSTIFKVKLLY